VQFSSTAAGSFDGRETLGKAPRGRALLARSEMDCISCCAQFTAEFLRVEGFESFAQLDEGAGEQPRDVHLADADLLRDLRLRLVVEEPQLHDVPLPFRQIGEHDVEQ
jgi:hypothetical protein